MPDAIPAHVRRFLEEIPSIAQLELLLLLHGDRRQGWSVSEAAKAQYTAEGMTHTALECLRQLGLVSVTGDRQPCYQYAPCSVELDQLVGELSSLYAERRVSVIRVIYSSPMDKLQSFGDAFRTRKPEGE